MVKTEEKLSLLGLMWHALLAILAVACIYIVAQSLFSAMGTIVTCDIFNDWRNIVWSFSYLIILVGASCVLVSTILDGRQTNLVRSSAKRPRELLADAVISNIAEDELDRGVFLNTFRDALKFAVQESSEGSTYLGLCGAWGCGKSCVYSLVENDPGENLKNVSFINTNGWLSEEAKDFVRVLFDEVYRVVCERGMGKSRKMASLKYLGLRLSCMPGLREYLALDGWSGLFSLLIGLFDDVDCLRKELVRILKEDKHKYVVAIDDIDRMTPKEIDALFRIIRGCGNLPNVTYLLICDRNHVAQSLSVNYLGQSTGDYSYGYEFLEKIMPFYLTVPSPPQGKLLEALKKRIDGIMTDFGLNGYVENVVSKIDGSFVADHVKRFRDVVMLSRSFRMSLFWHRQTIKTYDIPGVDLNDLLSLLVLRQTSEEAYRRLEILGEDLFGYHHAAVKDEWMNRFCKDLSAQAGDTLWKFMEDVGLIRERVSQMPNQDVRYEVAGDTPKKAMRFALSSPLCFEAYFTGFANDDAPANAKKIDDLMECLRNDNREKVLCLIKQLHTNQKLSQFLHYFSMRTLGLSAHEASVYLECVARFIKQNAVSQHHLSVLYSSITHELVHIHGDSHNLIELVASALNRADDLYVALRMLQDEVYENQELRRRTWEDVAQRINEIGGVGNLLSLPNGAEIWLQYVHVAYERMSEPFKFWSNRLVIEELPESCLADVLSPFVRSPFADSLNIDALVPDAPRLTAFFGNWREKLVLNCDRLPVPWQALCEYLNASSDDESFDARSVKAYLDKHPDCRKKVAELMQKEETDK